MKLHQFLPWKAPTNVVQRHVHPVPQVRRHFTLLADVGVIALLIARYDSQPFKLRSDNQDDSSLTVLDYLLEKCSD